VPLEDSRQWRAFADLIAQLIDRHVGVTVVIGPLNEHMLTPRDVRIHRRLVAGAER
jgi:hypothetical protein